MENKLLKLIKEKKIYLDGGTGTELQKLGLPAGTPPEIWNISNPDKVTQLHLDYLNAGSNIVLSNTFGINRNKYENYKQMISSAIENAKKAVQLCGREDAFVAVDIGPSGRMLKPLGDLDFEEAVSLFYDSIVEGAKAGADLVFIETMNDSLETKAAVVAAKQACSLPVFVTNVYDESAKLMTGASPEAMVAMLEGLGVQAIGMNCSLGPDKMFPIVEKIAEYSSLPIIVKPNAGLPRVENGKTVFDTDKYEFAKQCSKLCELGATIMGGCCGTTPEYIKELVEATKNIPFKKNTYKTHTLVSSYTHAVEIGEQPKLIGERINPTGKSKLKEALRNENYNYLLSQAVEQEEKGVHILDVNVGLPEIDECKVMKNAVEKIQSVTDLPLQIDSSDPKVLEMSMRIYNGKPLINSVNGKVESMESVFPLVKKYGGVVIALTLDENGIPDTAEGRAAIAKKIIDKASEFGINKKDIVVDPLALTVSSDKNAAKITLKAIELIRNLDVYTSLGVSNVSFGLPNRESVNTAFFTMALQSGLNLAIMNPFSKPMIDAYYSFGALSGLDDACKNYIEYASGNIEIEQKNPAEPSKNDLEECVVKGLADLAKESTKELLKEMQPLEIIDKKIIPALNRVGGDFEKGKVFLPQLLMSAEAASGAFEIIKEKLPKTETDASKTVILATVKGDIHDIGKNIIKVMLESYGFKVHDLGRDVPPEEILTKTKETGARLVGLSALMTTTVPAMEQTIKLVKNELPEVKVMVGGAVLNNEYAAMIKADFYGKDAMEAVRIAQEVLN